MATLTELLLATQDAAKHSAAEAQLKNAEQASADQYFRALAEELAKNESPKIARQLSGLLLKNGLAAKDSTRDRELKDRWKAFPEGTRNAVKQATTTALTAAETDIGKAAGQVLAKIGMIEIPCGSWPGLVPLLLQHVTSSDLRARQIALVTLGYLCEELVTAQENDIEIPNEITDKIITAVVQGMRDADAATKLEATRAFYHAVVLAHRNFNDDRERDFIMGVVLETCRFAGAETVQTAAFECLAQIATMYYDMILPYMNGIGPLTLESIKGASEKVAIPAIEFWSAICDEELDLQELEKLGQARSRTSLNIISQALSFLVPLLCETLTRQDSEDDDDTWNIAMAAGACLTLVAQVTGDACVDLVIAFVQANFGNPNWKYREAAILAYGSIMDGPSSEKMRPLAEQSYSHLVSALNDSSVAVRDTVSWTLGRIAQFHPTIVPVKQLTPILCDKLKDLPRVAANICWVIQVMAEAYDPTTVPGRAHPTTPLSDFFLAVGRALLEVTVRPDASEKNLRMAAFNALSFLVSNSGNDCLGHCEQLMQEMIMQLRNSFKVVTAECEIQGLICGVLTALTHRLRERVLLVAESVMEECLKVILAYQQVRGAQVLQEEALLLVSALANSVGEHFNVFMQHFAPHFQIGLKNFEDVQVCNMATGIVGDFCRALGPKMTPYVEPILEVLFVNLQNTAVDRKIKASIMTAFGDIALAITGDFEKYLGPVVNMLHYASSTRFSDGPVENEEWVEYLNSLREGVLGAYAGIIWGLRDATGGSKLHLFKEHTNAVLVFVKTVTEDEATSEAVMQAAIGVIGDLISVFQAEMTAHLGAAPFLVKLVQFASGSMDPKMQQTANWLKQLLARYGGRGP
eukprot:TRINITY_DN56150_c0_g1_i1.p1 TRINITY_DN56150_c0_g1~~TRINITY_DN56150_c0_g1_i1.p1  ORF type:complete len:899 (-),score=160.62 TRINITY_DN56150_c0_g1_i1:291-2879(-)